MARFSRRLTGLSVVLFACIGARATSPAVAYQPAAADYPSKPVRLIEPFGKGGGPDLLARALAPRLAELWGQSVIVENHTGAGATAAPGLVAKSPPDGYTLLLNTSAQAYSAVVAKGFDYDPLNDFIPIAPLTSQPYVLVAGSSVRVTTISGLIASAKAKPGALTFGSTGVGTGTHLALAAFNRTAGIEAVHVPAQEDQSIADVIMSAMEGRVAYTMAPISFALPHIHSGRMLALGVSGMRRSPLLRDVPTISEAGVADYNFPIWYGVWAPAGTPTAIADKLAADFARALDTPDMTAWLAKHGADRMQMTRFEFARFVLSETERAKQILGATVR